MFHIHTACCNEGIALFTCCLRLDIFPLFSHTLACQAVSPREGRVRSDWAITGRHQEYKQAQTASREESASNKPPSTRKQSTWHPITKPDLPPHLSHPVSCWLLPLHPVPQSPTQDLKKRCSILDNAGRKINLEKKINYRKKKKHHNKEQVKNVVACSYCFNLCTGK